MKSELGVGTTVIIRILAQTGERAEDSDQGVKASLQPRHALVVDDELLVCQILTKYLTGDGHTVETAADGREGLEKFQAGKFDLVIVDRAMPEMNGDELAAAIKQRELNMPVVMVIGFGDFMGAGHEKPENVAYIVSKLITLTVFREIFVKVTAPSKIHE